MLNFKKTVQPVLALFANIREFKHFQKIQEAKPVVYGWGYEYHKRYGPTLRILLVTRKYTREFVFHTGKELNDC